MRMLILLFTLLASMNILPQRATEPQQKVTIQELTLEQQAEILANEYDNRLALTPKQFLLVKEKIESTLEKRRVIESKYSGKEKLDQLALMQSYETSAMGEILTRIQFERYKELKPMIQPLEVID